MAKGRCRFAPAVRAAGVIRGYQRVEGASAVPPDVRFVDGLDLQPKNGRRPLGPQPTGRGDGRDAKSASATARRRAKVLVHRPSVSRRAPHARRPPVALLARVQAESGFRARRETVESRALAPRTLARPGSAGRTPARELAPTRMPPPPAASPTDAPSLRPRV